MHSFEKSFENAYEDNLIFVFREVPISLDFLFRPKMGV